MHPQGDVIDFQWEKCPGGYRIAPAEPLRMPSPDQWPARAAAWRPDLPPIPTILTSATGREVERIVAKSERVERYRPPDFGAIFETFARAEPTPEGMRRFADAYGLLFPGGDASVEGMLTHHSAFNVALQLHRSGDASQLVKAFNSHDLGRSHVELRLIDGRPRTVLVPENLFSFMWLQFALHAAGCTNLEVCSHCGQWFQSGTGTGRRSVATGRPRYCSNRCKTAHFRQRRAAK